MERAHDSFFPSDLQSFKDDFERTSSLEILEMTIEYVESNNIDPALSCQEMIEEIGSKYQYLADSIRKPIYFGFQCYNSKGLVTFNNVVIRPRSNKLQPGQLEVAMLCN